DELFVPGSEARTSEVPGRGWMWYLDKLLKRYDALRVQPRRDEARRAVVQWIVERQELDGSWGGIQPPWVYSLIALSIEGFSLEHPVMRKGLAGMERFVIDDERGWRFQACMSPVWDTAWAIRALAAAGFPRDHPVLRRAVDWMLAEQIAPDAPGDWQIKCKGVPCGGWAFEFDNDGYPDIDDTAVIVCALLEGGEPERVRTANARARDWVLAMRSSNGAWGAFDRDNDRELVYRMPFADFGALIDPPTEDVTAHVLEMLAGLGYDRNDPIVARGLQYLRETQRPSGAWFGRWGVNYVYGTWCVISALAALRTGDDMLERAAAWLVSVQNPDGGWGESCHSYVDESFAGVGASSASQTAWAVNALQLSGRPEHPACRRGLDYLARTQRPDGTWDEPYYTGTGFPRDFYINYHLYRHLFPLTALAFDRQHAARSAGGGGSVLPPEKVTT
ncbi:MAG: squalene--hopene cyclase, partial [Candidatus Eremiobacteraeota bacterium]|nr:squalene--hopene cyclase [Candidatus Eremiobacteraeota bacterium]